MGGKEVIDGVGVMDGVIVIEGVCVSEGVSVNVGVKVEVNVGGLVAVRETVPVGLIVGESVGVKVGVKVGVLEGVPVSINGVRLRDGVGDMVLVSVIVGVKSPGLGASAIAIHPRQ